MKSVLISIQPKWCELIANGKKTVEVRKTRPKLDVPFKCYIYCTNNKRQYLRKLGTSCREIFITENRDVLGRTEKVKSVIGDVTTFWENGGYNGKVIGEFVCDRIDEIGYSPEMHGQYISDIENLHKVSCVDFSQMFDYLADGYGYGWHISDLVIYDKPKELGEFSSYNCGVYIENGYPMPTHKITRPPQSWCYVETTEKGGVE